MQMPRRSKILVLAVVILLALSIVPIAIAPLRSTLASTVQGWTGLFSGSHPPKPIVGSGITGNISIANITPLCSNTGTVPDPNDNTTVVVTSQSGQQTRIPVNWKIIDTCELFGTFQASLDSGTYSLTLSYCLGNSTGQYQPPGCSHAACGIQSCNLPVTVVVEPGKLTPVSVSITTGIY